jgi:hypothetical protein
MLPKKKFPYRMELTNAGRTGLWLMLALLYVTIRPLIQIGGT